jgi:dUTP pyrophosphatase
MTDIADLGKVNERFMITWELMPGGKEPQRQQHSAGFDLYTYYDIQLQPGERRVISIGVRSEWDRKNVFGMICDRSGHAAKYGLTVLGGIIDWDYRGEWRVVLLNTGQIPVDIPKESAIAQVCFLVQPETYYSQVGTVNRNTVRGEKGFGSTG